jgi:hypothetical protein
MAGIARAAARRKPIAWLVERWRAATSVLLAGIAVPTGAIAGWAAAPDRPWWLLTSGLCIVGAGLLQLPTQHGPRPGPATAHPGEQPDRARGHEPPPTKVWNIPPPVSTFVNREAELSKVRSWLVSQRNGGGSHGPARAVALHGLGGIGKTQLARAYACRYRDDYKLGWWISAENLATITAALADLAPQLGVREDLPSDELTLHIRRALTNRRDWLLVFDNAGVPSDVEPFWPDRSIGHVLVTSRNHAWRAMGTPLPIDTLPLDEAVRLLEERTGQHDRAAATALATALGQLPLALEQAAAYIETQQLPIAEYVELFEQRRGELLAKGRPAAHQVTVDATFSLAFDSLREGSPAAAQLLVLCALLAPDQLPLDLLLDHPECCPSRWPGWPPTR